MTKTMNTAPALVEPQTQKKPLKGAWTGCLNMVSGVSVGHRHQCGPLHQYSLQPSTRLQAAAQTMNICNVLDGNICHKHHPSSQQDASGWDKSGQGPGWLSQLAGCEVRLLTLPQVLLFSNGFFLIGTLFRKVMSSFTLMLSIRDVIHDH